MFRPETGTLHSIHSICVLYPTCNSY